MVRPARLRQGHSYGDVGKYYESAEAVATLSSWYDDSKERAFVDHVLKQLPPLVPGRVVELGGGAGVHGALLAEHFADRYVMTDVAQAQVSAAVERGVAARVLDALEPEELGEPIAMFFSVGISTLITHEPGLRRKQFEAMARVLPPGGVSVVVLARFARVTGMHTPRRQEFGLAEPLEVISWGSWGLLPGKLRRRMPVSLANRVDALAGRCGLGLRRIAVLRKP